MFSVFNTTWPRLRKGEKGRRCSSSPQHTVTLRSRHTAGAAAHRDTAARTHVAAKQSHFTLRPEPGIREGAPTQGSNSAEERKKQDRAEAECIENRRENKVEKNSAQWPELQDGGWALPLLASGMQGSRVPPEAHSVLGRPNLKEPVHSQLPHTAPSSVQMSSLTRHPCSHGDRPGAQGNYRLSPAWAPPPPPLPL